MSIEVLTPSAISLVTLSPPIQIREANFITHSSKIVTPVVEAQISIHTTPSSFCLLVKTPSGELRRFGYIS